MADLAGAYTPSVPIISQNTNSILRYRATYYNGTTSINIPLVKGLRYIVYSLVTTGNAISMGFGQVEGTITDTKFTLTTLGSAGLDLSAFFYAAPFAQYKEPSDDFLYFIIRGETDSEIVAAIADFKG